MLPLLTRGLLTRKRFVAKMRDARQLVGRAVTHLRGGSWINHQSNARSVYRNHNHPGDRNNNIGFRVLVFRPTPFVPLLWPEARASVRAAVTGDSGRRLPAMLFE
jgi:hypothetical protein